MTSASPFVDRCARIRAAARDDVTVHASLPASAAIADRRRNGAVKAAERKFSQYVQPQQTTV